MPCHGAWTSTPLLNCPPSGNARRLKSTHPFVLIGQHQQKCSALDRSPMEYEVVAQHHGSPDFHFPHQHPLPLNGPPVKNSVVQSNYLSTAVERSLSCLHKWGMAPSAAYECGAEGLTMHHVVLQCSIHQPPHGQHSLTILDDETIEWLLNTCPEI